MKKSTLEQLQATISSMNFDVEIQKIFDHEKKHRNIDWLAFYAGKRSEDANVAALLSSFNIKGDVNLLRTDPIALMTTNDEGNCANMHIANSPEDGQMIDYVQGLEGADLKNYVVYITQKLQLAETQTSALMIGVEVASGGIIAIGTTWAIAAIKAFRAGGVTVLEACAAGIATLGIKTAITAIGILVVLVLIPFLIFMDKKAEMLAFILNRTNKNITMTYYLAHGKIVAKPHEMVAASNPPKWVSITKGIKFGESEVCSTGIMLVSKRDKALVGVEGACHLAFDGDVPQFPNGIYLGFSVPLAIGDNSCYISWDKYSSCEDFFNSNYDKFTLKVVKTETSRHIQARVDKPDGGEPAMIAVIQAI